MIYVNGRYMEEKDAVLSPFDHGFYMGSVFSKPSGSTKAARFCLIGI